MFKLNEGAGKYKRLCPRVASNDYLLPELVQEAFDDRVSFIITDCAGDKQLPSGVEPEGDYLTVGE